MTNWNETYRGTVPPWECDVTEHFTIAYYFDRLGEAERSLAEILGLREFLRGGRFPRHFDVRFVRELRAGSSFHIESAALAVPGGVDGMLRLGHRFVDSANGETVMTMLRDLNSDLGVTVVIVTHDPRVAGQCHRIVHLLDGEVEHVQAVRE